ncbi:uncharacterized protein LOC108624594 isoform X2 [Ceratina calcarata]|uniref:Uncharacterized protein LOC108624594 isoform X2 n=1 Tax=Ceratina calcarata TaxID=156304 RepID=A0AAJ7S0H2_9HYME|nr:uncharacterized protein LOC108624594 isoform X2 [Ceratina calcarata]
MYRTLFTVLLSTDILFHISCKLFQPNHSNTDTSVYPLIEKWARSSPTKMLTIVLDDYEQPQMLDFPKNVLNNLNVSKKLVSLKYLISLRNNDTSRGYETVETGNCVLLLFTNMEHLRDLFNSPHLISFWHPENFYILEEQGKLDSFDRERFCKWAFDRLWRFRRVYKLLLFTGDKAIRYDPFDYTTRYEEHYVNTSCDWDCIESNDSFLMISNRDKVDVSDLFDEGRRDFKSYPLKISIFKTTTMPVNNGKFGGLDFNYLEEVCKRMNVTPRLIKSNDRYGWEENGAFFGSLGHLVYEYADVSFNHFFIKDYLTRQIEFSTPINTDRLCVFVPKAAPVPDHLVIVKLFTGEAWLLLCAVQFVISMIYTMLRGKRNVVEDRESSIDFAGNRRGEGVAFAMELGRTHGPDTRCVRIPREKYFKRAFRSLGKYLIRVVLQSMQPFKSEYPWFPERLLLMCSLFLSLILNGIVTSQLASTFSKRLHYKDIDTLEELEESGLPILTNTKDVLPDALADSSSPLVRRLHNKLRYGNDSEIDQRVFEARDAAFLHRLAPITLKYTEYQMERLHVVNECPREVSVSRSHKQRTWETEQRWFLLEMVRESVSNQETVRSRASQFYDASKNHDASFVHSVRDALCWSGR